jgi:predicted RecB family nuclease
VQTADAMLPSYFVGFLNTAHEMWVSTTATKSFTCRAECRCCVFYLSPSE